MEVANQVDFEEIERLIEEIRRQYGNEKLMIAYEIYLKLFDVIEAKLKEDLNENDRQQLEEKKKYLETDLYFNRLRKDAQKVKYFMSELNSNEGWTLQRDDGGTQTYFKQPDNNPVYMVKAIGTINANTFNVLALINEIELFPRWIPTIQEGTIDYHISDFKKMVYLKVVPPAPINWVISPREMVLYAYGVDMMEENRLMAVVRTPSEEDLKEIKDQYPEYQYRANNPSIVRMNCYLAGIDIQPIDETHTKVSLVTCVDPKIVLPYYVINIVTKQFAHMIITFLGNHAANLSQEYHTRINKSDGIYQNIKNRLQKENNNNNADQ